MAIRMLLGLFLAAAPAHAGEVVGDCFPDAVPASQRTKLVNMHGGDRRPLGIWSMNWASGYLVQQIMDILATEKFGYQTRLDGVGASSASFYAVAGCENPFGLNEDERQCGPLTTDYHVSLEAWGGSFEPQYLEFAKYNPAIAPTFHGGIGYYGSETYYVLEAQLEAAWNAEALSLDWYRNYNTSWFVPWVYFENAAFFIDSNSDLFQHCADTQMGMDAHMKNFLDVTGDADGVEYGANGLLKAKCVANDTWWLSPSCRNNASRCIFTYSGGNGWSIPMIMQKAAYYNMPLGIAVAKDWSTYVSLCQQHASFFLWWEPDTTFLSLNPKQVTFERHDKSAWAVGDQRTASESVTCHKFTWYDLSVAAPDVYATVANMEITLNQINTMLLNQTMTGQSDRTTACLWLRDNPEAWAAWLPNPTECIPGQGLVNSTGGFVDTRADAASCEFCAQGRYSFRVVEPTGPTYVCLECSAGTYQSLMGQEECSLCAPGTYNDEVGQSECSRCRVGKYQPSSNTTACIDCQLPRTTMVLGAADILECVCPDDMYQPLTGGCVACSRGLECPINSMEANIPPGPGEVASACAETDDCAFPVPGPKFFATYADPLSVYECLDELSCPGGALEKCGGNMEGLACGGCEKGYFRNGEGICEECTDIEMSRALFPTLPLLIGPPAVVMYYMASRDGVERWGSPGNQLACVGYTVLVYLQSVAMLLSFKVDFPVEISNRMKWSAMTNDPLSLFRAQCATFSDFTVAFVGNILMPVYVFALYVLVYGASVLVSRFRPKLRMRKALLFNCYGGLLFTFYISIASQALSLFQCYTHPNGKKSLRSSPSTLCGEQTWTSLLAVAIPAVLIFCVATLALLAYVLYVAPTRFQDETFRMQWKFALIKFRPSVWWWGIVVLLKGLVLNLTMVLWESGTAQLAWIQTSILVYTSLTYSMLPWRSFRISCLEALQHCFLVFLVAFMPHFIVETSEQEDLVPIIFFATLMPLVGSAVIGLGTGLSRYQELRFNAVPHPFTQEELKETCKVFGRMTRVSDWPDMMLAMQTMSDTDVRTLARARDIIVSELAVGQDLKHCTSSSKHMSFRTTAVLSPGDSPGSSPRSGSGSRASWFRGVLGGSVSTGVPCVNKTGEAPQPDDTSALHEKCQAKDNGTVSEGVDGLFSVSEFEIGGDHLIEWEASQVPGDESSTFVQGRPTQSMLSLSVWRAAGVRAATALQT